MKKKLGVPSLILSAIVMAAGCASSGAPSTPKVPEPWTGDNWAEAVPAPIPSRPAASATAMREAR